MCFNMLRVHVKHICMIKGLFILLTLPYLFESLSSNRQENIVFWDIKKLKWNKWKLILYNSNNNNKKRIIKIRTLCQTRFKKMYIILNYITFFHGSHLKRKSVRIFLLFVVSNMSMSNSVLVWPRMLLKWDSADMSQWAHSIIIL